MEDGTRVREASKVVIVDPAGRLLLFRYPHSNESGQPFWTVPGGGVKPGETHEQAARRELREETGIDAPIGPLLWTYSHIGQEEQHYLVRVPEAAPIEAPGPDPDEPFTEARWWSAEELECAEEDVFPRRLASLLRALVAEGPPPAPLDAGA
ncbi:MAG TPA: NUDIX domain-containing protein [Gaiellaceae bacterium]|nr:NUDIX domain-containing protein [Gaiellaceae bacterium]